MTFRTRLTHTPATTNGFLSEFDDSFNQLVSQFWPTQDRTQRFFEPPVDIVETEQGFLVSMDVPGFAKDDIKIEVKDDFLHVTGERTKDNSTGDRKVHLRERTTGRFERSFRLGKGVDWSRVDAKFENGVLDIALAKSEAARSRTIAIK